MRITAHKNLLNLAIIFLFVATLAAQDARVYSDSHYHLLNSYQSGQFDNGDGKYPGSKYGLPDNGRYPTLARGDRGRRIEVLLTKMERSKVEHVLLMGFPFVKLWSENESFARPKYYLDTASRIRIASDTDITLAESILEFRQTNQNNSEKLAAAANIHPFLSGFDATNLGAIDLVVKRIKEYPDLWEGIGEVMIRHDDLTNLTSGDRPRADHPALLRITRFAGRHYLPVLIHHNIAPVSSNPKKRKEPIYLDEFINLLRYNRWSENGTDYKTAFIWSHAGVSRRVKVRNLDFWIDELLNEYGDQVYIDISWLALEKYVNKDMDAWVKLISKYPDQFMLGTDVVGKPTSIKKQLKRYDDLLAKLPKKVAKKIAYSNLVDLLKSQQKLRTKHNLGKRGVVLHHAYEYPDYQDLNRSDDATSFTRSRSPD